MTREGVVPAASMVALIGVCALILVAPFEKTRPLIQMPGQSISTVEAALLVVFGAWAVSMIPGLSAALFARGTCWLAGAPT